MEIRELVNQSLSELRKQAQSFGIKGVNSMGKQDLIMAILRVHNEKKGHIFVSGILEVMKDKTHGVLEQKDYLLEKMMYTSLGHRFVNLIYVLETKSLDLLAYLLKEKDTLVY